MIPTQVWETGASARVLDLARNSLEIFPQDVSNLINLKVTLVNKFLWVIPSSLAEKHKTLVL